MATSTNSTPERLWYGLLRISPRALGIWAALAIMVGSYGGGAIRNRGGLLQSLGLDYLAFGHGAGFSNITFWIGTTLFVCAWFLMGRRVMADICSQRELLRTLSYWIIPLIFAAPIMSRDVYSYLMQGELLRNGFDPYTQGPAVDPGPYLFEVSHDWRNTTTPYGPLHLWIGKIITQICGENVSAGVFCFKILSLAGFAAMTWAIPHIASRLGGNPVFALWIGAANPLMVFHLVGGMHNESIMVGMVSVGIVLALRNTWTSFLAAVALIAAAVSLKATAALVLPFIVWMYVHPKRHEPQLEDGNVKKPTIVRFLLYAGSGALLTIAVLALITLASGANWGWITALTGNTKVINPLAFPSLITSMISSVGGLWIEPFPYNEVLNIVRKISMVCMALGLILCWWHFRNNAQRAVQGMCATYCVAFFFNAVTLPWYYASVLSLIGTFPLSRWLRSLSIGASIIVAMAFSGSGNHQLYNPLWMTAYTIIAWAFTRHLNQIETRSALIQKHHGNTTTTQPS